MSAGCAVVDGSVNELNNPQLLYAIVTTLVRASTTRTLLPPTSNPAVVTDVAGIPDTVVVARTVLDAAVVVLRDLAESWVDALTTALGSVLVSS